MSDNLVANTMSEAQREVKKPETMKSYLWIQTAEGSIQEVEKEVAILCPTIDHLMKSGHGSSKNKPISLLPRVKPTTLSLVFDYCRFHQVRRSDQEYMSFDENFLQMDVRSLCELANVANYLQLRPLIDCTSKAMAEKIRNKSTEEICHMLDFSDDLTEADKLQLREYSSYDSRIRLLNRLYAKKKKKIEKDIENVKNFVAGMEVRQHEDTRTIDDLVSFINEGDIDSKGVQTSKKKKNRKKREGQKKTPSFPASSLNEASIPMKAIENHDEDSYASDAANPGVKSKCSLSSTSDKLKLLDTRDASVTLEDDIDDGGLDPALDEKFDRKVEEFARRINLNAPDRMLDIYSSSQQSRLVPLFQLLQMKFDQ